MSSIVGVILRLYWLDIIVFTTFILIPLHAINFAKSLLDLIIHSNTLFQQGAFFFFAVFVFVCCCGVRNIQMARLGIGGNANYSKKMWFIRLFVVFTILAMAVKTMMGSVSSGHVDAEMSLSDVFWELGIAWILANITYDFCKLLFSVISSRLGRNSRV